MAKKITFPKKPGSKLKLKIDHRTIITISNARALADWLRKYPNAEVVK